VLGLNELDIELTDEVSCIKAPLLPPAAAEMPLPGSGLPIPSVTMLVVPFPVPLFPLSSKKVFFK